MISDYNISEKELQAYIGMGFRWVAMNEHGNCSRFRQEPTLKDGFWYGIGDRDIGYFRCAVDFSNSLRELKL